MSLGICINAPEGIVFAAESRLTLQVDSPEGKIHVNYDNANKLMSFGGKHRWVGAVTYGLAAIGLRTPHSFLPEFESSLPEERLSVQDFAKRLSEFYMSQWTEAMPADYSGPDMTFVVAGFDKDEAYGRTYLVELPRRPEPVEQGGLSEFGLVWGGQKEWVDRLLQGFDARAVEVAAKSLGLDDAQEQQLMQDLMQNLRMEIPVQVMPLQDCIDLAAFFVRTTIDAQRLTVGLRGCGGPVDIATITRRDGMKYVQRKEIVADGMHR